ncbi:MAG TPA: hypothetical protein VF322_11155 [Gammaproteobacteria bacterium]
MAVNRTDLKLIERCAGVGELSGDGRSHRGVRYDVRRFQGMAASGLPVPGLFRIEGSLDVSDVPEAAELVGKPLTLTLDDGRALRVTLADASGRVLAEGHGPSRCSCC